MSDRSDDEVPTDPWGNPLPPDQWPQEQPPVPPPGPVQPGADQPGYASPTYGQPASVQPGYGPQGWGQGGPPGPEPPPDWTPQGYGQPPWAPQKTEGMAIGALVCGILGTLCGLIGCFGLIVGPIAIVLGVVARRRIRDAGGLTRGDGLALAGLVLGIIGTVASVGWVIAFAAIPELRDRLEELTSTTTTSP